METIKLDESESIKYMVEKRDDMIQQLNDILKRNDSVALEKSQELLQSIFQINSNIKLLEDVIVIKTLFDNKFDVTKTLTQILNKNCAIAMLETLSEDKCINLDNK